MREVVVITDCRTCLSLCPIELLYARQLRPWYADIAKRQVRAPKVYLRDPGLLHSLLSLPDWASLLAHPRVGASWEGFAIEQALQAIRPAEAYFRATDSGAGLDLLLFHRGRRWRTRPL